MKKLLLKSILLLCALVVGTSAWATPVTLVSGSGTSGYAVPTGWTSSGTVAGGSYLKFDNGTITSPEFAPHTSLSFTYTVATFGSGTNHPLTIRILNASTNAVIVEETTATPTSSSYTDTDSPIDLGDISVNFKIQLYAPTGKGIRLRDYSITGEPVSSTPSSSVAFANSSPSLDLKDAATFTQTATTAEGYAGTAGASVTYSIGSTNTANATINSSGVVTPTQAGTVVVNASAAAIDGKYLASYASYTLTVTDTREWDVTCHIGNNTTVETRVTGATLSLDEPSAKYGMAFAGWSSSNNTANPTWISNDTKVTGNMELYAMYLAVEGEYSYHLVESSQADWRGDYLIAYSSTVFANGKANGTSGIGSASTVKNPGDNLSGKIVAATWGDNYYVTLEAKDDDDLSKGYVLKTQDGYYNYQTSDANGLSGTSKNKATAANYPITVNFESSAEINLELSSGPVFRYNTSEGYFRYYKSTSYSGMGKVYLYKRTADTAPIYSLGKSLGTKELVTIGSSKYAAYCSSNALDFSGTDVKAYKAKVNEGKVVLTLVNYVPANEGVILYGDADDYDVPQIAAAGAVSDNELIGVTTRTLVEWETGDDGKYNYILQNGQFKKAAAGGHLKANRAYLHTSYNVESSARDYLEFSFEGEEEEEDVTGVTDVRSKMSDVRGDFYNLNGQKVQNPTKGLYIVNGKKVVVK